MLLETSIIDYIENEEDIKHWLKLKGEYRYKEIIKWMKTNNIECTWENVTNYMKYDKRLLINSFKYIVFLEELMKSEIFRKHNNNEIIGYEFNKTITNYLSIDDLTGYDNMNITILKNEQKCINSFRNAVVHNKILLDRKFNGKTLEDTLNTFKEVLPNSYRTGFVKDINSCFNNLVEDKYHIEI